MLAVVYSGQVGFSITDALVSRLMMDMQLLFSSTTETQGKKNNLQKKVIRQFDLFFVVRERRTDLSSSNDSKQKSGVEVTSLSTKSAVLHEEQDDNSFPRLIVFNLLLRKVSWFLIEYL
jgi:hypothetical protein